MQWIRTYVWRQGLRLLWVKKDAGGVEELIPGLVLSSFGPSSYLHGGTCDVYVAWTFSCEESIPAAVRSVQLEVKIPALQCGAQVRSGVFYFLSFLLVLQMHIPGHAGYRGNEEADRLSREGAVKLLQQHEEADDCHWTDLLHDCLSASWLLWFAGWFFLSAARLTTLGSHRGKVGPDCPDLFFFWFLNVLSFSNCMSAVNKVSSRSLNCLLVCALWCRKEGGE